MARIGAAPCAHILSRLVYESIEADGPNIGLELPIPLLRVKLGIRGSKRCPLFVGESTDAIFELLKRTHTSKPPCPSRTMSQRLTIKLNAPDPLRGISVSERTPYSLKHGLNSTDNKHDIARPSPGSLLTIAFSPLKLSRQGRHARVWTQPPLAGGNDLAGDIHDKGITS
jgi:hypothetical protein